MENNDFEFKPLPPGALQDDAPVEAAGGGGPVPAGFNERFVAYVVDAMPFVLLARVTGDSWLWKFLWMGLYIVYETAFSSGGRATAGKWLMNIRVRAADGGDLSVGKAFVRSLSYFLSSLTLNLGYLMALFTRDNKALHDLTAGSRVVSIKERSDLGEGVVLALSWGIMVILLGTYLNNTVLRLSPSEKKQIIAAHRTISKLGTLELIYMRQNGAYTHELAKLADLTGNVNAVRAELFKTLEPGTLVIASNGRRFKITAKARNWRKTEVQVLSKVDAPRQADLQP